MEELDLGAGFDHDQAIGLGDLGSDLCEMLGPRHANRDWQSEFVTNPAADRGRYLGGGAEEMRASGHVGERLVDRYPFHQRGEVAESMAMAASPRR